MKKPIYTILALVSASLSLVLTLGWLLNRNTPGDWFEESGFFINLFVTFTAIVSAVVALVRIEPRKIFALASFLLATPGLLLGCRILIAIGSLMYHGDT